MNKKLYFAYPIVILWGSFIVGHLINLTPNDWYAFPAAITATAAFIILTVYAIEKQ